MTKINKLKLLRRSEEIKHFTFITVSHKSFTIGRGRNKLHCEHNARLKKKKTRIFCCILFSGPNQEHRPEKTNPCSQRGRYNAFKYLNTIESDYTLIFDPLRVVIENKWSWPRTWIHLSRMKLEDNEFQYFFCISKTLCLASGENDDV